MSHGATTRTDVPFLDLGRAHADLVEDVLGDVREILTSSAFVGGPRVAGFEQLFAEYCGAAHCVGVASGLDAIRLSLQALGVGPQDEVVVPAMTFVATFEAVSQVGATPVPVDVTERDYCLDPTAAAASIGSRTRAILPVHLYGQMADMSLLADLSERHELGIVEDAAQAHGSSRHGTTPGELSDAAAFSFYPGKNLGAMGDAGAVITSSPQLAEEIRALREHGQRRKYAHDAIGWTARLDAVQAAFLTRKLEHLDRWNAERVAAAASYSSMLDGVGDLALPPVVDWDGHVWHLYVVRTADPEGLRTFLSDRGVGALRHYPEPPHLSRAYEHLGLRAGAFPVAESIAAECLSLPIFPGITDEEQERVVDGVRAWFAGG